MKTHLIALGTALVFVTAPALAGEPAPPTQESVDDAATAEDAGKQICKKFKEPGSRLASRKVCMTAAMWRDYEENERRSFSDARARVSDTAK